MAPRLQILSNVIQRLKNVKDEGTGYLYGVTYDNTLTLLTFSINLYDEEAAVNHTTLQLSMPAEVYLCGILHIGEQEEKLPDIFQDIDITDNPLLLKYSQTDSSVKLYFYIHQRLELVDTINIVNEAEIGREFTYVRLQGHLPLAAQNNNVVEVLEESRKKIGSGKIGIHFPSYNTYLFDIDNDLKNISFKELIGYSGSCESSANSKKYNSHTSGVMHTVEGNILLKMSIDSISEEHIKHAPVLQHIRRPFNSLEGSVNIDALSLVHFGTSTADLYGILVESICRNIKLIEKCLEKLCEITDFMKLPLPIHFRPQTCGHLFTLVYQGSDTESEDKAVEYRKSLHNALGLDCTRPYFRFSNAVKFYSDAQANNVIINPHEALTEDSTKNMTVTTVYGFYAYHHYMQDNFDDNGWGCAYRSLQTIVSWFRLQGYTNIAVPTHREIQKCLVDIGDKASNFIGSKQWIGSTEVGFVLETLLGINIKILCASTGDEITTMVSNLKSHFETQGTPIMIGGGVLAHTILGIGQNEDDGNVKFLILDPHYTGTENLHTIISKGWCGWKTKDFWKKDAFYNMCLPQRPLCV